MMEFNQPQIEFMHTYHSQRRSQQRGVSMEDIEFILKNSKPVFKQGFRFYSLKNKCNKSIPVQFKKASLMNLIVMTCGDGNTVITVYKNDRAWKRIKRKNKYLS